VYVGIPTTAAQSSLVGKSISVLLDADEGFLAKDSAGNEDSSLAAADPDMPCFLNIAFSYSGMQRMGLPQDLLTRFSPAFKEGMANRAAFIGDQWRDRPEYWEGFYGSRHSFWAVSRAWRVYRLALGRVNCCYTIAMEHTRAGFSLVELMVVVALFSIITFGALMNHARFGEQILTTNLAYDIALTLREAQSYGFSVRENTLSGGVFDRSYGVHFAHDDSFVFFVDKNANGQYSGDDESGVCVAGDTSECLKVYRLERGSRIASVCGVVAASGESECRDFESGGATISFLDVLFTRPEPDAFVRTTQNGAGEERYRSARIAVVSPKGRARRAVEVFQTGQISIGQ